jgi:DNA-binding NarL/FixJ family response regulator
VISIAIQERRALLRTGLESLLAAEDDLEVVASLVTDDEVRAFVRTLDVDVLILEAEVEEWDVIRLLAELRRDAPELCTIGLHQGRRSDFALQGHPNRPSHLLAYGSSTQELVALVRGESRPPCRKPPVDRRVLPGREVLTPREREVLRHISAGLTTTQSAALLSVSPKTIDNHKQRMFAKLGVQNQAHAVAVAHRVGILSSPSRSS